MYSGPLQPADEPGERQGTEGRRRDNNARDEGRGRIELERKNCGDHCGWHRGLEYRGLSCGAGQTDRLGHAETDERSEEPDDQALDAGHAQQRPQPHPEGELCDRDGSYAPFAATRAEREAKNDPRPSLEERYSDHAGYVRQFTEATEKLVAERLLLREDADLLIAKAKSAETAKRFGR